MASASAVNAQSTFSESFTGSSAAGWVFGANPGDTLPVLTGTDNPSDGVDSNPATDLTGQGWLRLNTNTTNQSTFALLDTQIFSVNANIEIEMQYTFYNGSGADGITFFLVDGSVDASTFTPGAYGGSMGYAQKTDEAGMPGGYLGFAFDNFGNYSNGSEGRSGGITNDSTLYANRIAVRGPESSDYAFIAASPELSGLAGGGQMDFPSSTSRPDQSGADFRSFKIIIDANNQLTVLMKFGSSADYITAFTADLSGYERPDTFKIGFTGATGSQTEIHEIRNISVTTTPWSGGAYEWDNGAGTTAWGTLVGGEANTNWFASSAPSDNRTPLRDADVLFGNKPTNNPGNTQQVRLANNVEVRNLTFDTSINYVIGQTSPGAGNYTIILGDTALVGLPSINVNDYNGAAANHVINANLSLAEDVAIRNFSASTLSLNGTFANNGENITLSGTGTINLNGVISGAGALIKNGGGTTTLAAANTYSGATSVNEGVLQVNAVNGLGSTGAGTTVASGGTLAYGGTGATFASEALSLNGAGSAGQGALYNASGNNTLPGAVSLASDSAIGAATGTNLTLSGVLSGTAALDKTGAGTVTLSGTNTHSGSITVSAGTLAVSGGSAIGNSSALTVESGATFNLSATSETIGSLAGGGSVVLGSRTLTFGGNNGSTTYSGSASGTGAFVKQGTGTATLSGASSYTGGTTINAGTLLLANSSGQALGSTSGLTVNTGGTLSFGASHQINDSATLTLAGGTVNLSGASEVLANVVLAANTTSTIDYLNDGSTLRFTGTGTEGSNSQINLVNWSGNPFSGSTDYGLLFNSQAEATDFASRALFTGWSATIGANVIANGAYWEVVPIVAGLEWNGPGTGNWDTNNWWNGTTGTNTPPDSQGAIAILGNRITANTTATVDMRLGGNDAETLGRLIIDTTGGRNYIVENNNNSGTYLEFDVGGTNGQTQLIVQGDGTHVISAAVRALDNLTITNNSTATTGLTLTDTIDLRNGANSDLIVSGAGNTLISGAIIDNTDGATLLKTGTGTLTLTSGNSNFTGGTTLRGGTIQIGEDSALGSGAVVINDSGTPALADTTFLISDSDGGEDFVADITVNNFGATTTIGATNTSGTNTYSGDIALNKSVNLSAAAGGIAAFTGVLSGTGGVTKTGAGTVTFSGNNTYTGATTVDTGTLRITAAERIANTSALIINAGGTFNANAFSETVASLSGAGTLALGTPGSATAFTFGNATDTTFSGSITGGANAAVVKTGTGTTTFSGASTYAGDTTIATGTLVAANSTALGATSGNTTVNAGATLALASDITIAAGETLTLNASANNSLYNQSGSNTYAGDVVLVSSANSVRVGAASGSTLDVSGAVSGSQSILKTDAGTLVLSGSSANTFSGGLHIAAGVVELNKTAGINAIGGGPVTLGDATGGAGTATLRYAANNQLPDTTALNFRSDGRLDMNGRTDTVASINSTVAGAGQILIGTGQLIVGSGDANSTFSGTISGSSTGVLEKIGTGTLTLSDADTLRADRVMSFGGEIKLESGALYLDNITLNVDTLRLTGNSVIDFGATGNSVLNVNNLIVELANGEITTINNWNDLQDYLYAQSFTSSTGGANIPFDTRGQAPQNRIVFANWTGNNTWWQSGDNQVTPVPEPASYGALAVGGLVTFSLTRRRRRAAA